MRRNPDFSEQGHEPKAIHGRTGRAYPVGESDDDDEEFVGVAHQRNQAPMREADEEDVAEEDIMEILDVDEVAKR